mgnify:CR=1 FL=1
MDTSENQTKKHPRAEHVISGLKSYNRQYSAADESTKKTAGQEKENTPNV